MIIRYYQLLSASNKFLFGFYGSIAGKQVLYVGSESNLEI